MSLCGETSAAQGFCEVAVVLLCIAGSLVSLLSFRTVQKGEIRSVLFVPRRVFLNCIYFQRNFVLILVSLDG